MQPLTNCLYALNSAKPVNLEAPRNGGFQEPTFFRISDGKFQLLISPFTIYNSDQLDIISIPSVKIGLTALFITVKNENIEGLAFTSKI